MSTDPDSGQPGARRRDPARTGSTGTCPPAPVLDRLARGVLPLAERTALLEHVAGCAACGAALAARDALSAHDRALAAIHPRRGTATFVVVVASVIVLALGAVLWLPRLAAPLLPDTELSGATVGEAIEPAADAVLDQAPVKLRWRAEEPPAPMRVRLVDASATPLWESETTAGAEVDIPESVRVRLMAGSSYGWEVVPVQGGAPVYGPFRFSLRR